MDIMSLHQAVRPYDIDSDHHYVPMSSQYWVGLLSVSCPDVIFDYVELSGARKLCSVTSTEMMMGIYR